MFCLPHEVSRSKGDKILLLSTITVVSMSPSRFARYFCKVFGSDLAQQSLPTDVIMSDGLLCWVPNERFEFDAC